MKLQSGIVIALTVLSGTLTYVAANAPGLGLPPVIAGWLGVVVIGVGLALNQMEALGAPPKTDPPKP